MPRYSIHIGPALLTNHSELPIAFCLIGKRREDFERPSDDLLQRTSTCYHGMPPFTQEEEMEARQYRWHKSHGKYAVKPLGWVESEEEGEALKSRFDPNEWDVTSFALVPVQQMP